MEKIFESLLSTEEKIISVLEKEERSTYWLHRKTGKSQTYIYRLLYGKGKKK